MCKNVLTNSRGAMPGPQSTNRFLECGTHTKLTRYIELNGHEAFRFEVPFVRLGCCVDTVKIGNRTVDLSTCRSTRKHKASRKDCRERN